MPKEINIEEIKKAQEDFEKSRAEEERARRQEEQKRRDEEYRKNLLQQQAQGQMLERLRKIEYGKHVESEKEQMEEEGIKERIEEHPKIPEKKRQTNRELIDGMNELGLIIYRIGELERMVMHKKEEDISPEVREALKKLRDDKTRLSRNIDDARKELARLEKEEQGTPRSGYEMSVKRLESLRAEVKKLEENPFVLELLEQEARTENGVRNEVIYEALKLAGPQASPERQKFIKEVCHRFVSEEIKAEVGSPEKSPEEYTEKLKSVRDKVLEGLRSQNISLQGPGVLLKNIMGEHGTFAGTFGFLKGSEVPDPAVWNTPEGEKALNKSLAKHLGVLNFIRAYGIGMTSQIHRKGVLGGMADFAHFGFAGNTPEISRSNFVVTMNGPLLPKESLPRHIRETEKQFGKDLRAAQKLQERMIKDDQEKLAKERKGLEGEVARQMARKGELATLLAYALDIDSLQRDRDTKKEELLGLGIFNVIKRSKLNSELRKIEQRLTEGKQALKKEGFIKEAKGIIDAKAAAEVVRREIRESDAKMEEAQERLKSLTKI